MRLILLANSYKHQGRCIAGISLDSGEWIRPVSPADDGRIPTDDPHIPVPELHLLDIVHIPVTDARGPGHERENRLYTTGAWRVEGRAEVTHLLTYREWEFLYPNFGRKIPYTYLEKQRPVRTLQLIEAKQIRWERNEFGKCRAYILDDIFDCADIGFSITDPVIISKLEQGQSISSHCLLCLSLSQPFQGRNDTEKMCYRLVAGVIELLPEIELIAQEMQRVGWTIPQGRAYLRQHFAKESRYQLTALEAQAFLDVLRQLPALE
ncbi:MAG: hypothetical protein RMI89_12120 [Gloeomargarita sp. SKYBB_i_bin120]|nr:hypothetical protein [Gloeomargarita sp. SKYG98]MCS7293691.1 hypothetical protein [Gloeomargarita sp. SKYB120]MDW8179257.1 hypothetical protein [Gloeomargarita sp. SKYBB_i_bin120]